LYYQVTVRGVADYGRLSLAAGSEPPWLTYYDPWHPVDQAGEYTPPTGTVTEQKRAAGLLDEPPASD